MISEKARVAAEAQRAREQERREERDFACEHRICPHCGGPVGPLSFWQGGPLTCKPCGKSWADYPLRLGGDF